jgi:multiple sugar transport system substrate-binding protein
VSPGGVPGYDEVPAAGVDGTDTLMRTGRRLTFSILGVVGITALTACGSGGGGAADADFSVDPTGTVNAWGFENADDVGQSRLDFAAAQLPDLDVQIDATAFDAQKFTTAVASGNIPDVVQMSARYVGTYAARGLITPLDECLAENSVETSHWYDSVIGDVTYSDSVYGIPQFYQPPAILVNTPLLEAAGLTLDDLDTSDRDGLLAAAEAMYSETGGDPSTLGFDADLPGSVGLWMIGAGGSVMDDEGRPTLDDPVNVETLEFLTQLTDAQGGYAAIKSFKDTFDTFGVENPYATDQVAAQIAQQWYPNVLAQTTPDVEVNAVPFRDADGQPFTVASGQAFVIPVGAANPAAACAWMLALTSDDAWMAAGQARAETNEAEGYINTGLFTGSPEADQLIRDEYVGPSGSDYFDQVIETFYDVVGEGTSYGSSAAGQEIQTELENAVVAALNGEKEPQQALTDAQAAAERAFDEAQSLSVG